MTDLEALVGLNKICDIGTIRLRKLLGYFDKPENILKASKEKLLAVSGIAGNIANQIHSVKKEDIDREFDLAKRYNLKILTVYDKEYPWNLKNIPDPPIVIYVKGNLKEEDKFSIAIVGSRRASFYGLASAERFAAELSCCGFTIVSGMARGIDTYAHKGAIKQGNRTIAVMGYGLKHIYPPENKELIEEIAGKGAVVSEFPMDAPPLRQNFPRRNRVISGLSLGVLVVEAARNSGALITADFALEQGREVFALPGKVDSRTSFGTNGLIKQGAKLVSCVDDVLEEFNLPAVKSNQPCEPAKEIKYDSEKSQGLSCQEALLLHNLVYDQPLALDEIVEQTNLNVASVLDVLLKLQMKKLVRQLPGKQFIRMPDEQ